jgi:hypothetical protein
MTTVIDLTSEHAGLRMANRRPETNRAERQGSKAALSCHRDGTIFLGSFRAEVPESAIPTAMNSCRAVMAR